MKLWKHKHTVVASDSEKTKTILYLFLKANIEFAKIAKNLFMRKQKNYIVLIFAEKNIMTEKKKLSGD